VEAARKALGDAQEKLKTASADDLDELTAVVRLAETEIAITSETAH
jgi:hypothetical protein